MEGRQRLNLESMRIPDDDAHNWIKIFQECGLGNKEIDEIMSRLNDNYAEKIFGNTLAEVIAEAVKLLKEKHKKPIPDEIYEKIRQEALKVLWAARNQNKA